ncbi:MAG: 2,3-diphosphoglycerate-dependent phosphoglycerate mutase [Gammaproteobacteria bacterium]|nr:MAG: 2,3-diphosphoglycerate-dependent phosphoglycerate mutase [Gammaproteobacteria bacterium]
MKRLVLLRHGQSEWNKKNLFTGWTDVDLTEQGIAEAKKAGQLLKAEGFQFKVAFTSYLKRAVKTLNYTLDEMDLDWIPVRKDWRLNEKHYGELQGLNKAETAEKYGDDQVLIWRRSYDVPPAPLDKDDPRSPLKERRYADIDPAQLPLTESLKDTIDRILPYWRSDIQPTLEKAGEIIVAAHGNSLRAIVKHLKNISNEDITGLNLPTGIPYLFEFDNNMNLVRDTFLGDPEEVRKLQEAVANQAKNH